MPRADTLHGTYVLLVRDGRLLVLMREEDDHPLFKGIWDVPGGLVEEGEDTLAAALRETEEETGLRVEGLELLRAWEHPWTGGRRFLVTTYVAWDYEGELRLSEEHSAHAWMTPAEILAQPFAPHQLSSPVFLGWLDGWREDLRLLGERLAART